MSASLTLPDVMAPGSPKAPEMLRCYFTARIDGGRDPKYTGAMFERLGGGGDRSEVAGRFTAEDLVAITMLSVSVPAPAAIRILGPDAAELSSLLAAIPNGLELVDAEDEQIGPNSAASRLWNRLCEYGGINWVKAGKLLARKRPRLIPVYDRVVQGVVGRPASYWLTLRSHLQADDRALYAWLCRAREVADLGEEISAIRVFDVLVWMTGKGASDGASCKPAARSATEA